MQLVQLQKLHYCKIELNKCSTIGCATQLSQLQKLHYCKIELNKCSTIGCATHLPQLQKLHYCKIALNKCSTIGCATQLSQLQKLHYCKIALNKCSTIDRALLQIPSSRHAFTACAAADIVTVLQESIEYVLPLFSAPAWRQPTNYEKRIVELLWNLHVLCYALCEFLNRQRTDVFRLVYFELVHHLLDVFLVITTSL
jgi:hypothetical protein